MVNCLNDASQINKARIWVRLGKKLHVKKTWEQIRINMLHKQKVKRIEGKMLNGFPSRTFLDIQEVPLLQAKLARSITTVKMYTVMANIINKTTPIRALSTISDEEGPIG